MAVRPMTKTDGERIASLETLVTVMIAEQREMRSKIEDLLAIRNKGIGAFWLASTLIGTSIVGAVMTIIDWVKG